MKKSITQSKALKATLVGAVAFTPVLAVMPTADAATDESYRDYLAGLYSTTVLSSSDALAAFDTAATYLDANITSTELNAMLDKNLTPTKQAAANRILDQFFTLVFGTETNFVNAFNNFKTNSQNVDDVRLLFGPDITADAIGDFAMSVQNSFFQQIRNSNSNTTAFYISAYATALLSNDDHPVYPKFRSILDDSATVINELNAIAAEPGFSTNVTPALNYLKQALREVEPYQPPATGGGGTPVTPPVVVDGELAVDAGTVTSNPQAVIAAINAATTIEELVITLPAGAEEISIPVTILLALESKNEDAVIVVETASGSFNVPVSDINLAAAAAQLGVTQSELSLKVTVDQVTNPLTGREGITVLSPAVDFKVSLTDATGKEYVINRFSKPVTRALIANGTLNPLTTVAVVVHPNGTYSAVPTFVPTGNSEALFYRNTTSVYTLIENFQTFKDVDGGKSWAEDYVEKLASRMIVKGVNDEEFKPSAFITRGEFAALLSRGLGITAADMNKKVFKDVTTDQAANKNGEVYAAVEAGLIQGYEDGTFRPYDRITRDQAAIMISRAIAYLGDDKVTFEKSKNSTDFNDYAAIGATARPHVERVYEAGYIEGFLDDTFRPGAETNRAQMAKILYNFLQSVKHIN